MRYVRIMIKIFLIGKFKKQIWLLNGRKLVIIVNFSPVSGCGGCEKNGCWRIVNSGLMSNMLVYIMIL